MKYKKYACKDCCLNYKQIYENQQDLEEFSFCPECNGTNIEELSK